MPNHVEHDLVVSGPAEALRAFEDFAREGDNLLSANKFIPYPKACKDADAAAQKKAEASASGLNAGEVFSDKGFEWCCEHWGTKWGLYDVEKVKSVVGIKMPPSGSIAFTFSTAWSSCMPVLEAMSKRFPTLRFEVRYYECGMGFQGHYVVTKGKAVGKNSAYDGERGG